MKHIMVSTVNLGIMPGCVVASMAAVQFQITGEWKQDNSFAAFLSVDFDIVDCEREGLELDAEAVTWWLAQDDDTRSRVIAKPRYSLAIGLGRLTQWVKQVRGVSGHNGLRIWHYGPALSTSVLEHAYTATSKVSIPWSLDEVRDVQTAVELAGVRIEAFRTGSPHDPKENCLTQIRALQQAYEIARPAMCAPVESVQAGSAD